MFCVRWVATALFLVIVFGTPAPASAEGFRDLFNGKDLDGWVAEGVKDFVQDGETKPVWSVKDGEILCTGKVSGSSGTTARSSRISCSTSSSGWLLSATAVWVSAPRMFDRKARRPRGPRSIAMKSS